MGSRLLSIGWLIVLKSQISACAGTVDTALKTQCNGLGWLAFAASRPRCVVYPRGTHAQRCLGTARRAWLSSPAEQMWQLECGAQAMAFTLAWWRCSSATGSVGKRMSSTITCADSVVH